MRKLRGGVYNTTDKLLSFEIYLFYRENQRIYISSWSWPLGSTSNGSWLHKGLELGDFTGVTLIVKFLRSENF